MFFGRRDKQTALNLGLDGVEVMDRTASEMFATTNQELTIEDKVDQYFEQFNEQVFRYLTATFGNSAQVEEIMQEAFLSLYNAMDEGPEIQNVRAWVFRVAHNLAIDQIRGRQFIASVTDNEWDAMLRALEYKGLDPEQVLLQKEKFKRLSNAVSRLTLIERECLNLRSKGFRYREIGEILKIGTTTVADTLGRVIDKLAKDTNG